jgi:hypothetical protein
MTSCAQLTLVLLKDRQRSEQNLKCLPSITGRTACGFQHQNSLALSSDDPLGLRYTPLSYAIGMSNQGLSLSI